MFEQTEIPLLPRIQEPRNCKDTIIGPFHTSHFAPRVSLLNAVVFDLVNQ